MSFSSLESRVGLGPGANVGAYTSWIAKWLLVFEHRFSLGHLTDRNLLGDEHHAALRAFQKIHR